jgi:hypothetical protein
MLFYAKFEVTLAEDVMRCDEMMLGRSHGGAVKKSG